MTHDHDLPIEYRERQEAQLARWRQWVQAEGGHELPTRLSTLMRPEQQARVQWLAARRMGSLLEIGCNWGYVLAACRGQAGCDVNPDLVNMARVLNPDAAFEVADARKLPYASKSFETVMLPEVLEHLPFEDVERAIAEACRVARARVPITIPDGRDRSEVAESPKHVWICDREHMQQILRWLHRHGTPAGDLKSAPGFWLIDQWVKTK